MSIENLAIFRLESLGVVEPPDRPVEIEHHGRRHHRPKQAPAAHFVDPGHTGITRGIGFPLKSARRPGGQVRGRAFEPGDRFGVPKGLDIREGFDALGG